MEIKAFSESILKHKTNTLVVGAFEDEFHQDTTLVDKALGGIIKDMKDNKEFTGKLKEMQVLTAKNMAAQRVLLVGLGKKKEFDAEKLRKVSGAVAKFIRSLGAKDFTTTLHNTLPFRPSKLRPAFPKNFI